MMANSSQGFESVDDAKVATLGLDGLGDFLLRVLVRMAPSRAILQGIDIHEVLGPLADEYPDDFSRQARENLQHALVQVQNRLQELAPAAADESAPELSISAITWRVLAAFVGNELALLATQQHFRDLNSLISSLQRLGRSFQVLPQNSLRNWERIVVRLQLLPRSLLVCLLPFFQSTRTFSSPFFFVATHNFDDLVPESLRCCLMPDCWPS
jgi:hypothetical protein